MYEKIEGCEQSTAGPVGLVFTKREINKFLGINTGMLCCILQLIRSQKCCSLVLLLKKFFKKKFKKSSRYIVNGLNPGAPVVRIV